jgi:hypothetical protein
MEGAHVIDEAARDRGWQFYWFGHGLGSRAGLIAVFSVPV